MLDCGLPLVTRAQTERNCRRVLLMGDVLLIALSFSITPFLLSSSDFPITVEIDPLSAWGSLAIPVLCAIAVLEFGGAYPAYSGFERAQQISLALGSVFLLEAFLSYIGFAWLPGLAEISLASVLSAILLVVWFLVFRLIFPNFPGLQRVLLLGSDGIFPEIGGMLAGVGYEVLGPLPFPDNLRSMTSELAPDEIVVGDLAQTGAFPANELLDLRFHGVAVVEASAFVEATLQRVSCRHLEPIRFLYGEMSPKRQNMALQAVYSNLLGLASLLIALPVLICAAIAVKLSAPSESLLEPYRAIGLHGIPFDRLRFQATAGVGPLFARLRLQGLPQLINVVRGEMSLVGPRPCRVEFRECLTQQIPFYAQRVAVRPGLTGWAQIHSTEPPSDALRELEYDLYYIKHVSPAFDLDILLASIFGRTVS